MAICNHQRHQFSCSEDMCPLPAVGNLNSVNSNLEYSAHGNNRSSAVRTSMSTVDSLCCSSVPSNVKSRNQELPRKRSNQSSKVVSVCTEINGNFAAQNKSSQVEGDEHNVIVKDVGVEIFAADSTDAVNNKCFQDNSSTESASWDNPITAKDVSVENVVLFKTKEKRSSIRLSLGASETDEQHPSLRLIEHSCMTIPNTADIVKPKKHDQSLPSHSVMTSKPHKHRRKDRLQRSGKKWKKVPDEMKLDLKMSLFPRIRRGENEEEAEIEKELERFQSTADTSQISCDSDDKVRQSNDATSVSDGQTEGEETRTPSEEGLIPSDNDCKSEQCDPTLNIESATKSNCQQEENKACLQKKENTSPKKRITEDTVLADCDNFDIISLYEERVPRRIISALECVSDLGEQRRPRTKKKWKIPKAHVQVKTKHCSSLSNSVHGQTFYIHHRVMKRMSMAIGNIQRRSQLSMKQIDKYKGKALGCKADTAAPGETRWQAATGSQNRTTSSRFAMDAYNADSDLSADLVNILLNLQHRDLLPEDYDLLLRLDDRVKPKTVDNSILTNLKTDTCQSDMQDASCAICMEHFKIGETTKCLPCGHSFHSDCIDSWLSNSSVNCPLDGIPVALT